MNIGSVRILLNNPFVMIGSTCDIDEFTQVPQARSALPGRHRHLAVLARAQVAPVEVVLWRGVRPAVGEVIFSGELDLGDGYIAVFDVENSTRFTKRVGSSGFHAIAIVVDDVASASRITIALDPTGDDRITVGDVAGFALGDFVGSHVGPMDPSNKLGLVLSGFDRSFARLASALKIIFANARDSGERTDAVNSARVQMVVEWMRWLSPDLSMETCRGLGSLILTRLSDEPAREVEVRAIAASHEIWQALHLAN